MRRAQRRAVLGGGLLALALVGCSAGPLIDRVPEAVGGLPAGAPARPVDPYQYPAVHDMPPPREAKPLSEEEQVKLEKELQATRDRQAAETGERGAGKKPAATTKKQPAGAKTGQKTGVNTGAKMNP